LPIERVGRFAVSRSQKISSQPHAGASTMGKGNNSQKNDKKSMKPKQDKAKPAAKK
jgi:hypothetical protein